MDQIQKSLDRLIATLPARDAAPDDWRERVELARKLQELQAKQWQLTIARASQIVKVWKLVGEFAIFWAETLNALPKGKMSSLELKKANLEICDALDWLDTLRPVVEVALKYLAKRADLDFRIQRLVDTVDDKAFALECEFALLGVE